MGSPTLYPGACALWVEEAGVSADGSASVDYTYENLSTGTQRTFDAARLDEGYDSPDAIVRGGACPEEFAFGSERRDYSIEKNHTLYSVTTSEYWGGFNIGLSGKYLFVLGGLMVLFAGLIAVIDRRGSTEALVIGQLVAGIILLVWALVRLSDVSVGSMMSIGFLTFFTGVQGVFTGIVATERHSLAIGGLTGLWFIGLLLSSRTLFWMLGFTPLLGIAAGISINRGIAYLQHRFG